MTRTLLLACGIASSVLYVAMLVVCPKWWTHYSSTDQAVSELFAIGAPSRTLFVALGFVYDALVILFSIGLWNERKRGLRWAAIFLGASAIVGAVALVFAPMHMRGAGYTLTDELHKDFTIVSVLLFLGAMIAAAASRGISFRVYSAVSILGLAVMGMVSGRWAPALEANLPTPWFGLEERIDIGVYLVWVAALAATQLRAAEPSLHSSADRSGA